MGAIWPGIPVRLYLLFPGVKNNEILLMVAIMSLVGGGLLVPRAQAREEAWWGFSLGLPLGWIQSSSPELIYGSFSSSPSHAAMLPPKSMQT